MAFNLKDEAQEEIIGLFGNAVEEIANETQAFFGELTQLSETAGHARFTELVNKYIMMYNEDIKREFEVFFQEWEDGESSLYEFAVRSGSGDITEDIARDMQNRLREGIEVMCPGFDEAHLSTDGAEWKDEYIEELTNKTNAFSNNLDSAKDGIINEVTSKAEENTAFACIQGLVEYAFSAPISLFKEILEDWKNVGESVVSMETTQKEDSKGVAETAKTDAERAGTDIFGEQHADFL